MNGALGSGGRRERRSYPLTRRRSTQQIPTACSWLNAVETFFSRLTRRRLKRGSFASLVELQAAIHRFVAETNGDPKPFVWTADPHGILERVHRAQQQSASMH